MVYSQALHQLPQCSRDSGPIPWQWKQGQQLWVTTGSLNQGISAVLLENSSPGVCTALWQSGLSKCPQNKLVWNLSCTPWPFNKFRVTTAEYELGRELQRETNKKSCISFHKCILFVFTERTKAACLKIKSSAPPCTCQSNSRWRCGSSRCTCRGPVTPCYSWQPQEVSQCLEQHRENRQQGQVTQVQKEHKQQSCTNAALQARQLQVPGRVALKSLCTGTSNISSAVLLRLPGCGVWCFLQRARAVPEEGSRVPASTLSQPCFKLLAEVGGNARVCKGLPWGRVWRWQQRWLPSHTGSSPGTAPCNSLLTCECSVQGKQKAGWAWQENFSFPKHTVVGWSWLDARLPKPLCHSPSHLDRGEKV